MPEVYFKIITETLNNKNAHPYDIFKKVAQSQFITFLDANKKYNGPTLTKASQGSGDALYIKRNNVVKYYNYLESNINGFINDPNINSDSKAGITYELLCFIAQQLFENPTGALLNRYKGAIYSVIDYLITDDDSIKNLISKTTTNNKTFFHNVHVGIYSMGIAKQILKPDKHNMAEIAAGFFLHDIGLYKFPTVILQNNAPLSQKGWDRMKRHPADGFEILQKFNHETEETEIILLQHHERSGGQGYPAGLTSKNIHPYAKICTIADIFEALTSRRPYRDAQSSFRALATMQNQIKNEFDPQYFSRFVRLFGTP